jgi:hypothetical protein
MFCSKCGQQLPPQSAFCPACGTRTSDTQGSVSPAPQTSQPQFQPYAGQQPYVQQNVTQYQQPQARSDGSRATGLILGIGIPVLVLASAAILFAAGILHWPSRPSETEATTTHQTTKQTTKTTTTATTAAGTTATSQETTGSTGAVMIPANMANQEILDYFEEIVLRREYGGGEFDGVVCRWEQPVYVDITGEYTTEDYDWLISHIDYLNSMDGVPDISVVETGGNFHIFFEPLDQLPNDIPSYVEGNWGFISLNWNSNGQVTKATMGIATDVTSQVQRNHLILEEFTQGFGLLNDSDKYADSIFQMEWTEIQSISVLDELLVRMLYSPAVEAGMKDGVRGNLEAWLLSLE